MINPHLDFSTGLLEKKIERGKLDKFRNKSYPDPFYIGFQTAYTLLQKFCSSSRPVVFCLKGVLTNFAKFHKEAPALKTRFQWCCKSTEFNFIKKEFRYSCFLENYVKFPLIPFLKNSSEDCFYINAGSVYLPTTTFGIFKNNVTHIFSA